MNSEHRTSAAEYRCPGDPQPISRAVHLGRLAAFYPACRTCVHRDDTATLSPRQVEQLQEVQASVVARSVFSDEGAGGVYPNDFTAPTARRIAAAFAAWVREKVGETGGEGRDEQESNRVEQAAAGSPNASQSAILLASDGRPITAELTAAVGEGLRSTGCDVIDLGPATAPCLAFAVRDCHALGGVLVGNPGREPHFVGLQFWTAGPRPLSTDGSLEPVIDRYESEADRPARRHGALHRLQADARYLDAIQPHYHAMRPLRVVVDSASRPLLEYLERLAAGVACRIIPSRVGRRELSEMVRTEKAHFAASIDGDGETCSILDERGDPVAAERLLQLLAISNVAGTLRVPSAEPSQIETVIPCRDALNGIEQSGQHMTSGRHTECACYVEALCLEDATSRATIARLEERGVRHWSFGGTCRADMAAAMNATGASFGGGPSGRFWHRVTDVQVPDALMTVTRLLERLSRGDEPLSKVLDRDAPVE